MGSINQAGHAELSYVLLIRKVLQAARAKFAYTNFGQVDEYTERMGDTIKWYGVGDLTVQTAVITDRQTAKKDDPSIRTVSAQLGLYGNDIELTENLKITSVLDLSPVLQERLGYNAGKSIDALVRNTLIAGLTKRVVNGKTTANITSADVLTYTEVIDVVAALEANDAPKFMHPTEGEVYIAIISPAAKARFMKDATFREIARQQAANRFFKGEVGVIGGVVFCVTTQVTTTTLNSNVVCENTLVLGRGAYGVSALPLSSNAAPVIDSPTLRECLVS
jgi:N4-gp56 family major capsid protein